MTNKILKRLLPIILPTAISAFPFLAANTEVKKVEDLTNGEVRLSPGTMYGSLSKMEKDGLITFVREEEKRKIYIITELGREVLSLEMKRIRRLYRNLQEVGCDE